MIPPFDCMYLIMLTMAALGLECYLGAVVVGIQRVEVVRDNLETKRHVLALQPVCDRLQCVCIVGWIDILEPQECAMLHRCARGECVEQKIAEGQIAIAFRDVDERVFADVSEAAAIRAGRAQCPRESGTIGADAVGQDG